MKRKVLNWANQFNTFCFLDNCGYTFEPHYYECVIAAGNKRYVSATEHTISQLNEFVGNNEHWKFGHLSYHLKNALHPHQSIKKSSVPFPDFYFFEPEVVIYIKNNSLTIEADDPDSVYKTISSYSELSPQHHTGIEVKQRLSKEEYISVINQLQQHILRGDCYEINFCQEFFAEGADVDAASLFVHLTELSPTPFAALYKLANQYLICASPERFLTKNGNKLISQPMKGTARRNLLNTQADNHLKEALYLSEKERAENVMVVDLVRNDLSVIAASATVAVDELFGIYTFPQVHQMVSTVSAEVEATVSFADILKATFPMGSMTGAPKLKVMELIDRYEATPRGIFSGSVGYIEPNGNFDFNVVIRSIMYNASTQYLSYLVGSGITFYCDAENEWEECLLKGEAIKKVLTY